MKFPQKKHEDINLFLQDYSHNLQKGFEGINTEDLEKIAILINKTIHEGNTIYTCGNGGSSSISEHFVCDFLKGASDKTKVQPIIHSLTSNTPTLTAIANDIDYRDVFSFQLKKYASEKDILICISSSGNSENIVDCINAAKEIGVKSISFLGFDGGRALEASDYSIHIKINNYGIVEDIHQSLMHMLAQYIRLKNINDPEKLLNITF